MIVDIEKFKTDPSISFAYKYMDQESDQAKSKKYSRAIRETREEDEVRIRKKTPYIAMLTGVTMAFVIATMMFIGFMVYNNNPFRTVDSQSLPDLIGLKFDTVAAQYSWFNIVMEEEDYNEYARGIVYEQRPRVGTSIKEGSTVYVKVSMGQREIFLPNFTNQDAIQTFAKLRDLQVQYREERVFSDDIPTGRVVYTDPTRDAKLNPNDVVTVYVSRGPEQRTTDVPSLIGLRVEDAKRLLELYRLRLGEVSEEPSDQPSGTVIAQDPTPAGGLLPQGTEVNIVISKEGIKHLTFPIPLPNVDRSITIRARDAEDTTIILAAETFNPLKDLETPVWRPRFDGDETMTDYRINIYLDGKLYIEYSLNFRDETYREVRNRMDAEEFQ